MDEATNQNMDKLLNVLVRFYDEDLGKVSTQNLATKKVNNTDAAGITRELTDVLLSFGLSRNQVVSKLLLL